MKCVYFCSGFNKVWLGAKETDGGYRFTDGTTYDYHPVNEDLGEECLTLVDSHGVIGKACNSSLPFICMLPAFKQEGE